jgi:acyl dehydratase
MYSNRKSKKFLFLNIMPKLIINSFAEFEQHVGKELGVSEYHKINQFADATLDHQWIHTDPQRAATESQFKSTIAHGYLTLSLVPHLWDQIAEVNNYTMLVNYGIENLKFNQPVLVNQEVRLRVVLQSLTNLRGIAKTEMKVTLEIKDNPKPAFTATIVFLYHFK